MKTPTKVWPLTGGLPGYNATGDPIILQPGAPGWMDMAEALALEKAGSLDIMAGKTPQTLRKPSYETRVLKVERPPVGDDDPNVAIDEDLPQPVAAPKPKEPSKAKPAPRRPANAPRRKYKRTDLKAET